MEKKVYDVSNKNKGLYLKIADKLNSKNVGIAVDIIFAISLIPIIYVGFYNYATGDDYWYGVHTYQGWLQNGLLGALKGSLRTVAEFYENWQGTWFTMFLFTLSPNHFWRDGYVITVFISLGCLIGSIAYLSHFYLVEKLNFSKGSTTAIVCMISYLAIQYIPRTTSGIYWFNGIMHYSVPFILGVLAIVHSHKFIEKKRKRDYAILFVCFTLLGGGSYLAPLAATLVVGLILIYQIQIDEFKWKAKQIRIKYDWKNLWIILAIIAEFVGLVISFKAPGNNVRGGEEFGADLKWALQCIYYAIDRGIYLGKDYFLKNVVTTIVYIILAIVLWNQLWRSNRNKIKFRFPLLFVVYMNGVYWATYTPEIYSRSDVSGGVPNTYFHIFLIITVANIIYVHGWVQGKLVAKWEKKTGSCQKLFEIAKDNSIWGPQKYKLYIEIPVIIAGIVLFIFVSMFSNNITTNEYCIECIKNGSLKKYAEVRRMQDIILIDSEDKIVTVPEIDAPYPLLHMAMDESEQGYRNMERARYYNKECIKAEWVE